jgi:CRP/FNR family transcriptional regulator
MTMTIMFHRPCEKAFTAYLHQAGLKNRKALVVSTRNDKLPVQIGENATRHRFQEEDAPMSEHIEPRPSARARESTPTARLACAGCLFTKASRVPVLSAAAQLAIAEICRTIRVAPRQRLLEPGSNTGLIFGLTKGHLLECEYSSDGRRQVVRFLSDGDMFGRLAVLPYTHAVIAVSAAEVCAFPRDKLVAVMSRHDDVDRVIHAAMEAELAAAERHLAILGKLHAEERLAQFLLDRLDARPIVAANGHLGLSMTRTDIADYLGVSTETTSRLFTRLTKQGVLEPIDRQTVRVRDVKALQQLAAN